MPKIWSKAWKRRRASCAPSVHMSAFPEVDESLILPALEARMSLARTVVSLTLLLRNRAGINVRQPLSRILLVAGAGGVAPEDLAAVRDVILDEVNVRTLEAIEDSSALVRRSARANKRPAHNLPPARSCRWAATSRPAWPWASCKT